MSHTSKIQRTKPKILRQMIITIQYTEKYTPPHGIYNSLNNIRNIKPSITNNCTYMLVDIFNSYIFSKITWMANIIQEIK